MNKSQESLDSKASFLEKKDVKNDHILVKESRELHQQDQEMRSSIRAWDLESIKKLNNFPDETLIEDFLFWRNSHPKSNVYKFVISLPSWEKNRQGLNSLLGFRLQNELINFIKSEVKLFKPDFIENSVEYAQKEARELNDYHLYLNSKSTELREYIETHHSYPYNENWTVLHLEGLPVSNIVNSGKSFIVHFTESVLEKYSREKISERIYLNPRAENSIQIASQLVKEFEASNLAVQTKILNRAIDVSRKDSCEIRSEAIVVYSCPSETNQVLNKVLNCYMQNYQAFKYQPVTKLATKIAPGISVSTNQGFSSREESFNVHRAKMFSDAWDQLQPMRSSRGITYEDMSNFEILLKESCRKNGVNINNIAFPV